MQNSHLIADNGGMPSITSADSTPVRLTARQRQLRPARTCYDHLAGVLGVAVTEALVARRALLMDEAGFRLGPAAGPAFGALGVELAEQLERRTSRPLLRCCLDWTEKRPHLAGRLGAAVADAMLRAGWLVRSATDRSVTVTDLGRQRLAATLGLDL